MVLFEPHITPQLEDNDVPKSAAQPEVPEKNIIWASQEWIKFAREYLKQYPERDFKDPKFRLKKAEFESVQKKAIAANRQRKVYDSVLERATRRLIPIFEAHTTSTPIEEAAKKVAVAWSKEDYINVANQLHLLRPALKLLQATTPSGFTTADLTEAQQILPADKHRVITSTANYIVPLKRAFETIRQGMPEPTITTVDHERHEVVQIKVAEQPPKVRTRIVWRGEDWYKLAVEIHRRNPLGNHLTSETLIGVKTVDIIDAQRAVLDPCRQRPTAALQQSMKKNRAELLLAFARLKGELEAEAARQALQDAQAKAESERLEAEKIAAEQAAKDAQRPPEPPPEELDMLFAQSSHVTEAQLGAPGQLHGETAAIGHKLAEIARPILAAFAQEVAQALVTALRGEMPGAMMGSIMAGIMNAAGATAPARPSSDPAATRDSTQHTHGSPLPQASDHPAQGRDDEDDETQPAHVNHEVSTFLQAARMEGRDTASLHIARHESAARPEIERQHRYDHQQPMFDPKLPPADKPVKKPHVGVVGLRSDQTSLIERMFPNLKLTFIDKNTREIKQSLWNCDRIIGLQGFMTPISDGILKRQMKDRYHPVSGGMAALKHTLNIWERSGNLVRQ